MENKIRQDAEAFLAMRHELEKHHNGKYVLIHDSKLIGVFDTFDAATRGAQDRGSICLIRQVGSLDSNYMAAGVVWLCGESKTEVC